MIVKVKLFAAAKEIAGTSEVIVNLNGDATKSSDIASVRRAVEAEFPALGDLLRRSRFAVDQQYVSDDVMVTEQQEIAFIPPVSGG